MRLQIYKRHKTYWVRYTLDGKQYRRTLGVQDPTLARRIVKQLEKDIILGLNEIPTEKAPFSDFLRRYKDYTKAHKRPRTVATEQWALNLLDKYHPICRCLQGNQTRMGYPPHPETHLRFATGYRRSQSIQDQQVAWAFQFPSEQ